MPAGVVREGTTGNDGSAGRAVTGGPASRSRVTVVSVPAGHPYVQHALPVDEAAADTHLHPRVRVPVDRDPDDPSRPAAARWWPPVALDPAWLRTAELDLLHLHFGYDGFGPEHLAEVVDLLDQRGVPLVLTVHDLRNPHHDDPALLGRQLDVLVPRAAAVVTLTDAAAAVVRERWGREARVVPHPHVVDLDVAEQVRRARRATLPETLVVGVAAKELRRNTDPLRLLPALLDGVRRVPGAVLRVTAHHDLRERDDDRARALVAGLDALDARDDLRDHLEVVWHDVLGDTELWAELATQHVAVLPYLFGTHSGWLEACHDVGTRVLAPSFGCYADQGADATYVADETSLDEASLTAAVVDLLGRPATELPGLEAPDRLLQRAQVRAAHRDVYRRALTSTPEGGAA